VISKRLVHGAEAEIPPSDAMWFVEMGNHTN